MSIPWWVYLASVPLILLGLAVHFLPLLAAKLAAQDARRREELIAQGLISPEEQVRND